MSFESLLTQTATIKRNTPSNVDGLVQPSLSVIAEDVPCLIQEQLGQIRSGAAGNFLQYDAIGFFLPDLDLRPKGNGTNALGDLVIQGGTTYSVLHVGDESGQGHHLTAKLQREPRS